MAGSGAFPMPTLSILNSMLSAIEEQNNENILVIEKFVLGIQKCPKFSLINFPDRSIFGQKFFQCSLLGEIIQCGFDVGSRGPGKLCKCSHQDHGKSMRVVHLLVQSHGFSDHLHAVIGEHGGDYIRIR